MRWRDVKWSQKFEANVVDRNGAHVVCAENNKYLAIWKTAKTWAVVVDQLV